jgi:hypothetical protein
MTHAQRKLDQLHATFPGYTFWHVPATHDPDSWCWRPPGGTASDSQHRGTPEEVAAAITGTEHQAPTPATAPHQPAQ